MPIETRKWVGVALGLSLGCSGRTGPVHLSVELVVEHCPLVTSWRASPLQASAPDGTIDVSVTAREEGDADAGTAPLQYMWSATAGTFSDDAAATTVYKCSTAGLQVLTASVTDVNRRAPCADVIAMSVTCKAQAP
jgi:hypothetical protein